MQQYSSQIGPSISVGVTNEIQTCPLDCALHTLIHTFAILKEPQYLVQNNVLAFSDRPRRTEIDVNRPLLLDLLSVYTSHTDDPIAIYDCFCHVSISLGKILAEKQARFSGFRTCLLLRRFQCSLKSLSIIRPWHLFHLPCKAQDALLATIVPRCINPSLCPRINEHPRLLDAVSAWLSGDGPFFKLFYSRSYTHNLSIR